MVVFHQKMPCGAHTHVPLAGSSAYLCWAAAALQEKPEGPTQQVNKRCFWEVQSTAFIYLFSRCPTNALMTGAGDHQQALPLQNTSFPQDRAPRPTAEIMAQ